MTSCPIQGLDKYGWEGSSQDKLPHTRTRQVWEGGGLTGQAVIHKD